MRYRMPLLLLLVLAGVVSTDIKYPDEIPVPRPPEICNLRVTRASPSSSVTVTWSGGTPPFSVVRADAECFGKASEVRYLVDGVSGHRYVDKSSLVPGKRYWYQVFDDNSPMEVWYMGPPEPKGSDPKVMHPDGKGDCGDLDTCRGAPRKPSTWQ